MLCTACLGTGVVRVAAQLAGHRGSGESRGVVRALLTLGVIAPKHSTAFFLQLLRGLDVPGLGEALVRIFRQSRGLLRIMDFFEEGQHLVHIPRRCGCPNVAPTFRSLRQQLFGLYVLLRGPLKRLAPNHVLLHCLLPAECLPILLRIERARNPREDRGLWHGSRSVLLPCRLRLRISPRCREQGRVRGRRWRPFVIPGPHPTSGLTASPASAPQVLHHLRLRRRVRRRDRVRAVGPLEE